MHPPSSSPRPDDTPDLLRASQTGDAAAIAELLRRHLPGVAGFVRRRMGPLLDQRESQADVLQSVCADLLATPGLAFADEVALRKWLYAAALNKLRNHRRRFRTQKRDAGREQPLPTDGDVAAAGAVPATPSGELVARERAERLEHALAQLPAHYREVFRLARVDGLSYAQVAAATGRTEDSVRNVLARALTRLAELLEEEG
jgi:RNA polymerase sigma-70 factor (ECF subfamily)